MAEEVFTTFNAVVTCIGCRLSFMLTNVDTHEKFEAIISATEDHTVFIPINTLCDACILSWKDDRKCTPYWKNIKANAGDVATALLGNDVKQRDTIPLGFHKIKGILKEVTGVVELQVEDRGYELVVTKTPYVSGRMLLRMYKMQTQD